MTVAASSFKAVSLRDAPEIARSGTIPVTHKNTLIAGPELLRSAAFRCSTGARKTFADWTPVAAQGKTEIYVRGEELREDDKRVWLALPKGAEGRAAESALRFNLRKFCTAALNKADSSSSVESVKASLVRLQGAGLRIKSLKFEGIYSFLSSVEFNGGECVVHVSKRAIDLLGESTLTAIPLDTRMQLRDGLATWMLGFVCSHDCSWGFKMDELQAQSGLENYEPKEFTRLMKKQLEQLKAVGVLESYEVDGKKGTLKVTKH